MEISAMEIYWLLKLDDMRSLFGTIAIITIILGVFGSIAAIIFSDDPDMLKIFKKASFTILSVGITFSIVTTFMPTTKQMAAIIVAPKIINNKKVQQIPKDLLDILGLSLKKVKKDLKKAIK